MERLLLLQERSLSKVELILSDVYFILFLLYWKLIPFNYSHSCTVLCKYALMLSSGIIVIKLQKFVLPLFHLEMYKICATMLHTVLQKIFVLRKCNLSGLTFSCFFWYFEKKKKKRSKFDLLVSSPISLFLVMPQFSYFFCWSWTLLSYFCL